jgi:eukaryotic-like serine/threonine-protein kinase
LESYGLELGKIGYVPDYAKDAVLKQRYKGAEIKPGTQLRSGSKIDLVLGNGLQRSERVSVPNLIGLTQDEAERRLRRLELHMGVPVYDNTVKDTIMARVYKQSPAYSADQQLSVGQSVDLFFTQDASKIKGSDEEDEEEPE